MEIFEKHLIDCSICDVNTWSPIYCDMLIKLIEANKRDRVRHKYDKYDNLHAPDEDDSGSRDEQGDCEAYQELESWNH